MGYCGYRLDYKRGETGVYKNAGGDVIVLEGHEMLGEIILKVLAAERDSGIQEGYSEGLRDAGSWELSEGFDDGFRRGFIQGFEEGKDKWA